MHTPSEHMRSSRHAALAVLNAGRSAYAPALGALPVLGSSDHPARMSCDDAFETFGLGGRGSRLSS